MHWRSHIHWVATNGLPDELQMAKHLSEYEAAAISGLSPELLRWLTTHAPKQGLSRKLKVAEVKGETYFFEKEELLSFNNWLKSPWPHKDGQRPHIPTAIRREIKNEANGECAICQSHKDTCEAAHLDLVSKSNNNHPENLLWLCSNHHTAYDAGLFGPNKENAEFVVSFKRVLHRHKQMLWRMQHEISHKLFIVLQNCDALAKQLETAKTPEQIKAVEQLAKKTLAVLPALAPVSKKDPGYAAYKSISTSVLSLSKDKSAISARLQKAQNIQREYVAALGFVPCPLCRGAGRHGGTDCPVCNGDGEIGERIADSVDLRAYQQVDCPICKGEGHFRGTDCPACGGDRQMDRRYAESIDAREYQEVDCPLCEGSGRFEGSDCPACGGNARMDRRHADKIDLSEYEKVDCPLCKGTGRYEEQDCPECGGASRIQRRFADQVDLLDYQKVDCPVCRGKGQRKGEDCPACGGEAHIDRRDLASIDVRITKTSTAPFAKGAVTIMGTIVPPVVGTDRWNVDMLRT